MDQLPVLLMNRDKSSIGFWPREGSYVSCIMPVSGFGTNDVNSECGPDDTALSELFGNQFPSAKREVFC